MAACERRGLVRVEAPGQIISVSAPGDDDIVAIAEGLQVVDEATWTAALDTSAGSD